MIRKLNLVLEKVNSRASDHFTGLGLLVCDSTDQLPIAPLYATSPELLGDNLEEQLLNLSEPDNPYHDGFHIISSELEITHVAQYFYPSPSKSFYLSSDNRYGARYYVARNGSIISHVLYAAVISNSYNLIIFENGDEWIKPYD